MALLRSPLLQPGRQRQEEPRFRGEEAEVRRQDADDLSWRSVHANFPAEDVRIRIEALAPVGVGQDGRSVVLNRSDRLRLVEAAPHHRAGAKRREKVRRDAHDLFLLGRAGLADDFGAVPKDGKAREGRDVAAPFVVIRQRGAVALDPGFRIGVEDRDQPIGLRKRKRTEQNGIDHREDREVRSQADRNRGQRRNRERRSVAQLTKGEAKIVHAVSVGRTPLIEYRSARSLRAARAIVRRKTSLILVRRRPGSQVCPCNTRGSQRFPW